MRYVFMAAGPETNMTVGPWYNRIIGAYTYGASVATRYTVIPCPGTFKNFMFQVSVAPAAAKTWTIALYVDGVTTALSITITGATQTLAINLKDSVHVAAGAKVCITGIATAGTTLGKGSWSVDFISDKPNEFPICGGTSSSALLTASSQWCMVYSGNNFYSATANRKLQMRNVCPIGGTISNWYIGLNVAPGVGASWTFTLYKNAAATSLSITISDAATTGSDVDPTHAVVVTEGDTLQWYCTPSAAPAPAAAYPFWGFTFISNNPETWWIGTGSTDDVMDITGTTDYAKIYAMADLLTVTEANTTVYSPKNPSRPFIMNKLYIVLNAAPGAGKNWTLSVRQNGASPTNGLSVQVADANTTGQDVANKILIDPLLTLDMMITNNSPASATGSHWGIACWTPPEENQNLYKPTLHADPGIGLKRHPRSRIY